MANELRNKLVELFAITSLEFEDAVALANYLVCNGVTIPVRCKYCVNYNGEGCLKTYGEFEPDPMDFCSYGERKDNV